MYRTWTCCTAAPRRCIAFRIHLWGSLRHLWSPRELTSPNLSLAARATVATTNRSCIALVMCFAGPYRVMHVVGLPSGNSPGNACGFGVHANGQSILYEYAWYVAYTATAADAPRPRTVMFMLCMGLSGAQCGGEQLECWNERHRQRWCGHGVANIAGVHGCNCDCSCHCKQLVYVCMIAWGEMQFH